jgi:hypothetical protein
MLSHLGTRPTGFSNLSGKIRCGTFANGLATAAMRDEIHLLAFRAGAFHIGEAMAGPVTTP